MEQLLLTMIGKRIDVSCGGSSTLRGEVTKVENGVLHLQDLNHKTCFVQIDHIHVVWDSREAEYRAGFVSSRTDDR